MASIARKFASMPRWARSGDALNDVGALHTRLVPGFREGQTKDGRQHPASSRSATTWLPVKDCGSIDPAQSTVWPGR
jgi:hypothetical protein